MEHVRTAWTGSEAAHSRGRLFSYRERDGLDMSDINEAKLHEEAHFHDGAELHDVVLLHDRAELCDVVPLHEVAQFHNEPQPQVKKFTCKRENLTIKGVQYLYNYEEGHKYPALIVSHGFTDNYSGMEVYCENSISCYLLSCKNSVFFPASLKTICYMFRYNNRRGGEED